MKNMRQATRRLIAISVLSALGTGYVHADTASTKNYLAKPNIVAGPGLQAGAYQWGMHAMSFPAAWAITKGNAYVGAFDTGFHDGVPPANLKPNYRPQFSFAYGTGMTPTPWISASFPDEYIRKLPFHGTHVLGIIGATQVGGVGVVGGCPECSVGFVRYIFKWENAKDTGLHLKRLYELGMQVVNFSSNNNTFSLCSDKGADNDTCTFTGPDPVLKLLAKRDILVIASTGNSSYPEPRWPAANPEVLGVAAAENYNPNDPATWGIWQVPEGLVGNPDSGSNYAGINGVIAPGAAIVSTVPKGVVFGVHDCSDVVSSTVASDGSGVSGDGYGTCTGTSMAAPHVAALAGLLRSANPLATAAEIRTIIRNSGSNSAAPNTKIGYGMPNAAVALNSMFPGSLKNRLTPLFSLYSKRRLDFFYTTVPQMAMAAIAGTLEPRKQPKCADSACSNYHNEIQAFDYLPLGTPVAIYPAFPDVPEATASYAPDVTPRAEAWIFTTPINPVNASVPLVPLYRLSWKCGDTTDPTSVSFCKKSPYHTDTTYTTEQAGIDAYKALGYKLDGIEGYIYPKTLPTQPAGTERLLRKYNPTQDDHAIFPESKLAQMTNLGYTEDSYSDWLGYIYPNTTGAVPAIVTKDTVAPKAPTGLSAIVVSKSQINLSWTAATDNVGVTAYKIYRNGTRIATLGKVTSFSNTGLTPATTYKYTVQACDAAGNCSAQTGAVSAKTASLTYYWSCIVSGPLPPPANQAPNICGASNIGQKKTIPIYYNTSSYVNAECSCASK